MTVALNAVITPWVAILAIGALRTKTYDPTDLQAFAQGRHGGRYWFTGGWNVPAVVAWAVGAALRPVGGQHHAVRRAAGRHRRRGRREHSRIGCAGGLDLPCVAECYQGMTRSADEVVTEFCKLWASPDPDVLAGYFTEDAVYHNIPMAPADGPRSDQGVRRRVHRGIRRHRLQGAPSDQRRQRRDERAHRRHAPQGWRRDRTAGDGSLRSASTARSPCGGTTSTWRRSPAPPASLRASRRRLFDAEYVYAQPAGSGTPSMRLVGSRISNMARRVAMQLRRCRMPCPAICIRHVASAEL